MSYSNGIITAPISASDPYNVLGVSKTSSGYDVGYICSNNHGKINKWAKFKPVRYNVTSTENVTNWWKSQDGDCGLDIGINNYLSAYRNGTAYTYKAPRGGSSEPFRLTDFVNYNHNAQPFIKTHIKENFKQNINYATTNYYKFSIELVETSSTDLVFSDLNSVFYNGINNVYIAYDVYNKNPITDNTASIKRSVVNEINISNPAGKQIEIKFDDSDVGQTVYVLLYLKDTELPMTAPIPYDENNYILLTFQVTEIVGIDGNLLNIAAKGQTQWFSLTGSVSPTNAFSTNYGQNDIQMQITLKNNNITTDNISNYNFRVRVNGTNTSNVNYEKTITPLFLNSMNGSPIYSLQLPTSQTVTTIIDCGKLFDEYINNNQSKIVNIYLDAKLKTSNDWKMIGNRGLFIKQ